MTQPLLAVEDLRVHFRTGGAPVRAVDGVSFAVDRGETVCLVGESGAGKTVTCEALTKLLPSPPADVVGGTVRFDGRELTGLDGRAMREIRGDRIAHVFQNPQNALDPVYTVGDQLIETVRFHRDLSRAAARDRAVDLLDRVGIPRPGRRLEDYPHEFSGGMRQRVLIAIALAGEPDLLVADEPTTALDVTIEAQILRLLADLQAEFDMAVLLVTHDLGVVAEVADRVVVLYAGEVMEVAPVEQLFERPAHPYTQALLRCQPGLGRPLEPIGGRLPDPTDPPAGCRFHPRCPHAVDACRRGGGPPAFDVGDGQLAACVHYGPGFDADAVQVAAPAGERAPATDPAEEGP